MENLEQFNHQLPVKFKELCEFIFSQGFRIGIIGGVSRDFILTSRISTDLDCEIRPIDIDNFTKWPLLYDKLKDKYTTSKKKSDQILIKNNVLLIRLPLIIEKDESGIIKPTGQISIFYKYLHVVLDFLFYLPTIFLHHYPRQ